MALGPKQMQDAILRNLKTKTGNSAEEWFQEIAGTDLTDIKAISTYLKSDHGLGHFQAQMVAKAYLGERSAYARPRDLVRELFPKGEAFDRYAAVRDKLTEGDRNVRVQPCQTYVPLYRKRQFALLAPGPDGTLLLGVSLPEGQAHPTLQPGCKVGSARVNHHVLLRSADDLTPDLLTLLNSLR